MRNDTTDRLSRSKHADRHCATQAVRAWLKGLDMSRYADTFIGDGYDEMGAVLRMNTDHLLKIPGMKPGHAKSTPITGPLGKNVPSVLQITTVCPHRSKHLAIVIRLHEPDAIRSPTHP